MYQAPVRIEFTSNRLIIYLDNHYKALAAEILIYSQKIRIFMFQPVFKGKFYY